MEGKRLCLDIRVQLVFDPNLTVMELQWRLVEFF